MSEHEPRLRKSDGTSVTPGDAAMTRSDFMEAVKLMIASQQSQQEAQSAKTDALAELLKRSKEEFEKNDEYWLKNFAGRSAFNPRGENEALGGVPRDKIKGEVWWVGTRCIWHEHTYDELVLLNQLEAGVYHNGEWIVRDMEPEIRGSRKLRVDFANTDPDKRADLPSGYWDSRAVDEKGQPLVGQDLNNPARKGRQVTGMEIMLREMVDEAASRKPVLVA